MSAWLMSDREIIKNLEVANDRYLEYIGKLSKALSEMRFAYLNKDVENPHDFEKKALRLCEEMIGPFPDRYILQPENNATAK